MKFADGTAGRFRRRSLVIGALLTTVVAGLIAAGTGTAGGNATLTVQIVPGTITAGQSELAIGTFTNNGPNTLTHVVVTLAFPGTVSVTAPGCTPATGSTASVACPLGSLKKGSTARAFVTFVTASLNPTFTVSGTGNWDAGTQSKGGGGGSNGNVTATSNAALLFSAGDLTRQGNCNTTPTSIHASRDSQTTEIVNPPLVDPSLGLPCTPLAVGVDPKPSGFTTDIAIVDVPKLSAPATVELTFRDETLPNEDMADNLNGGTPSHENPNNLKEFDPAHPAVKTEVPPCGGPGIPSGFDSCIISVHATPEIEEPQDFDQGTITLRVQGTGLDPAYVG